MSRTAMTDAVVGQDPSIELTKDETWQLLLSLRFHYVYRTNKSYLVPLIQKLEAYYDSLPSSDSAGRGTQQRQYRPEG